MQIREVSETFLQNQMNKIVDFHNSHSRFESCLVLKTIYFYKFFKPVSLGDIVAVLWASYQFITYHNKLEKT